MGKPRRSVKATIHTELRPVINTPRQLQQLRQAQVLDARSSFNSRMEMLDRASKMVRNLGGSELIRTNFLQFLLDGPRDIDAECGYPPWLTPDHYRAMYDREGVAQRVVECLPDETWPLDPEVYENEDPDVETKFEKSWKNLVKSMDVFHYLHRIDVLSGIGAYGILLFGLDDGLDLREPVEGFDDDGNFDEGLDYKIQYMRPFSEEVVFVKTRETDVTNPRYGQPTRYTIQFRDFPNWGIQAGEIIARDVHWTRVIHVADNRKISEVYGIPRMQQVYNRLYDLRKIYASSGEGYWKGGFPGISFEMNPDINQQGVQLDEESIRKEMEKFQDGLQRYIAVTGLSAKSLPSQITEPTPYAESHLKAIAIAKGIPYRILFGSEEAKLAGDQDNRAWNRRVGRRQSKYVTPLLVRPFVDRLIAYGVLVKPKEYFVDWPDLGSPTDKDKAAIGLQKSQAMQSYVTGGGSQLMAPQDYLVGVLGYSNEEAESILDNAGNFNGGDGGNEEGEEDYETDEESNERDMGRWGGPDVPDQGNVLDQQNLSRSTTTAKGKRQVDTELVHMPELNQAVHNHVVKRGGKYYVVSQDRKKTLSKGYDSLDDANERLADIEYYKSINNGNGHAKRKGASL